MKKNKKSKNIKKIVIFFSIAVIVLVIILAFGSKILDRNYNQKLNAQKIFKEINISEYRIKKILENKVNQRTIKTLNQKVFVGETDKQIENGYYDIKSYIQDSKCIVIYLNKLWKEFDEKLYEEEYISEISESLKDILGINVPRNKIYDYIISGYLVAKNADNNSDNSKEYILDLDVYVIKGKVLEKEFVMSIYKK